MKYAQYPSDLVSIGTKFTSIADQHRHRELAVGIATVFPLLVYASTSDVYVFVNIIVQQSAGAGWPVVATIDLHAQDETTTKPFVPLFEAVVETRRTAKRDHGFRLQKPHTTAWESIGEE